MKILSPAIDISEILPMIEAGADEFFFGIDLNKKTNDANCLNLMPIEVSNFRSIEDARAAIKLVRSYDKSIYLCFNNEFYLRQQYALILKILRQLCKINGVIISDPVLLKMIRDKFPNLQIVASTRTDIFNPSALKYFISLGVNRFVLPRHVFLKDAVSIIKKFHKYSFEIFVKNENCPYINGFCTYTHNIWNDPCDVQSSLLCRGENWKREHVVIKANNQVLDKKICFEKRLSTRNCGICAIFYLNKYDHGNITLKLTSRIGSLREKLKDLYFIKSGIALLSQSKNGNCYRKKVKELYKQIYSQDCDNNCFY